MSYITMNDEKLLPVVIELNTLLADYNMYYQKLRSYHWNILGENFFELHEKFETLYSDARVKIDEIAERILTLRYHPMSKYSDYLSISSIKETSPLITDRDMVKEIIDDHRKLLVQMKLVISHAENAGDEGTIDLLGGYVRELEKTSWMLDAWTKNTKEHLNDSMVENTYDK
ncbi:Dps family protein [Abyssalbus ytuae]|uniref:DNA starvation/stationary phase protection protein n=1 Tax=Abyssalbus ytuae TaxID=2926907 RepID=A0A9E6ZL27_9FLAO|nr:DNA starvation/stationary phase protection protein [Abyssalbus ytuae]UOB16080.1 DNA starvation/stationary phase protection protein [Abyssalbus ytuae]